MSISFQVGRSVIQIKKYLIYCVLLKIAILSLYKKKKNGFIPVEGKIKKRKCDIKKKIKKQQKISEEHQHLFLGSKKLENDKTLEDYSIRLDQENDFSITVDRYMEVSFRDIYMNIFKINLSPLDDIFDVKKLIHEKINFEICYQRLVFGQKDIDDGQSVQECGIKIGSLIILVLRLRG